MSVESMSETKAGTWNDLRIEIIVGNLLRIGVTLAAAVVLFGGIIFLVQHGRDIPKYSSFRGEPQSLKSPAEIARGAIALDPRAIIQLGLLLLIATPVARVAFSAIAFALEHDHMYVVMTLFVLAVLMYSLFGTS